MTVFEPSEAKDTSCVICGRQQTDRCHITSKGAGGSNEDWNIIRMCRFHHSMQHHIGWTQFAKRFKLIRAELLSRGFRLCRLRGRWVR
jgi:hypothetical protein